MLMPCWTIWFSSRVSPFKRVPKLLWSWYCCLRLKNCCFWRCHTGLQKFPQSDTPLRQADKICAGFLLPCPLTLLWSTSSCPSPLLSVDDTASNLGSSLFSFDLPDQLQSESNGGSHTPAGGNHAIHSHFFGSCHSSF